jgi:hypothetical protein
MGPEFKLIKSSFRAASPLCWTMDERKPTPSRSLGTQSRAVLRVAGTRTGKNRWVRAFYKAGSVTAGNVSRVLHVLWLEVTGLLFLFLALVGGGAAVKEYHLHAAGSGSAGKSLLAAFFAVVFAYFGVSSFWRSRRRQR